MIGAKLCLTAQLYKRRSTAKTVSSKLHKFSQNVLHNYSACVKVPRLERNLV